MVPMIYAGSKKANESLSKTRQSSDRGSVYGDLLDCRGGLEQIKIGGREKGNWVSDDLCNHRVVYFVKGRGRS